MFIRLLLLLILSACGPDYRLRGIDIYALDGKPTKRCMKEVFKWLDAEFSCGPAVDFSGLKYIFWTDYKPRCDDDPDGCYGVYKYRTTIKVLRRKPMERSSLIHELNHHFLYKEGRPDKQHRDDSWLCVKALKKEDLFSKCK